VYRPKGLHDAPESFRLADRLGLDHVAFDEPGDEIPLRLDEGDHLGPDADGRRSERRLVLDAPVDPEQLRVLAADPEHVGAVVERDLEVPVRDPPAEHFDLRTAARPDPFDHFLDPPHCVGS